jgi:quercetin dioxygenase-like cupin family protein
MTGYRVLVASDAYWRPSNQMGVLNTDLAKQLGAETLGARLWRLRPGQASTRHRHRRTAELYVVIEGTGRLRVEDTVLTLPRLSAALVEAETVRQPFNDTNGDQLWLVVGAPPESANTLAMTEEELAWLYPDGPKALPPELDQLRWDAARRGVYGDDPEQASPPERPDFEEPTDPRD